MKSETWRKIFISISLTLAVATPVMSFSFGLTQDEPGHRIHGQMLLDYFLGRSDRAAIRPPVSAFARPPDWTTPANDPAWLTNNYFGGFFDLICASAQTISPFGVYETRHVIDSLFGVILFVVVGLIATELAGWRAGVLALSFSALSPRLVAHSMNNPKDLPFAALYAAALYFMLRFLRALPRVSWRNAVAIAVSIALAIDVRAPGLGLIAYFGLFVLIEVAHQWWPRRSEALAHLKEIAIPLGVSALVGIAADLGCTILWPSTHASPLTAPLESYSLLTNFAVFNSYDLFEGHWVNGFELPWYFVPKWFWISTPLFITAGLFLFLATVFPKKWVGWMGAGEALVFPRRGWLIVFAAVFPVVWVILTNANVYHDARHLLFVVPLLGVLAALGFENLFRRIKPHSDNVRYTAIAALAIFMIEPAVWMVRVHPHELFYFSPLIGGIQGAYKHYELDYWMSTYRSDAEWILSHIPPGTPEKPVRVRAWYGERDTVDYYLSKKPGYRYVATTEDSPEWDYSIMNLTQAKQTPDLLKNWPPANTVYAVNVAGVPVTAVVRNTNRLEEVVARLRQQIQADPKNFEPRFRLGYALLNAKQVDAAIAEFEGALRIKPKDPGTLNDIGVAYAMKQNWSKAVDYAGRALRSDPKFQLALGNFKWTQGELQKLKERYKAAQSKLDDFDLHFQLAFDLLNSDLVREALAEYKTCERLKPRDPAVLNDIGFVYGRLGQWRKLKEYCAKALAIDPGFSLARGNLAWAESEIARQRTRR